jgi:hypothetical protein
MKSVKAWYQSKIIGLAVTGLLGAVVDGITNGWEWRQYAIAIGGVALIVARAFFTDSELVLPINVKK